MPTPARRAAFAILLRVETRASFAQELLHGSLASRLSARDAALCTELVLGTLRWQATLDFLAQQHAKTKWDRMDPEVRVALRLGLYQLRYLSGVPARAAVHESVELVKAAGKSSAAGLVNAVLRKAAVADLSSLRPPAMSEEQWWSVEWSHPAWLLQRWVRRYGRDQALALAKADNLPAPTFLRPKVPFASLEEIRNRLRELGIETRPGRFLKTCLEVVGGNLAGLEGSHNAEVVIQDEASQLVPYLLSVEPGARVLDLCAAPGNKTAVLAQQAGERGIVVAGDRHLHRLRRMCLPPNARVSRVVLDGERSLPFRSCFDCILVDAPCTGTGTLRRNPELKWRLAPADMDAMAEKQVRLLTNAAPYLRPGGRLVYSTCSLEPEENHDVIERFLQAHPDFRQVPVRRELPHLRPYLTEAGERLLDKEFLQTWPPRDATDGFFAAILTKA